jgi:hypothetical protein
VHHEFGMLHPTQEMYRLLLRPDYALQAAMIDHAAHVDMVCRLGEVAQECYYCLHRSIPTIKESSVKGPAKGVSAPQFTALPAEPELTGVRFAAPASLSAVHQLPGQGFIPNTRAAASIIGW